MFLQEDACHLSLYFCLSDLIRTSTSRGYISCIIFGGMDAILSRLTSLKTTSILILIQNDFFNTSLAIYVPFCLGN